MGEPKVDGFGAWIPGRDEHPAIEPDQVEACKKWLRTVARPQRNYASSYTLKHVVEKWAGTYISNGALIRAALDEGWQYREKPGSPNVDFMIDPESRDATDDDAFSHEDFAPEEFGGSD